MKAKITFLLLIVSLLPILGASQEIRNADNSFMNARDIAFAGNRDVVRDSLERILYSYPNYDDAKLLLAKTYSWDGEYDEARKHFNRITSVDKLKREAWIASIKNEVYAKNLTIALGLANKALVHLQVDAEIEALRSKIIGDINKKPPIQEQLKEDNREEKRKNTIAVSSKLEVFDVVFDPMHYVTAEYQYSTKMGKVLSRINYAQRFNSTGAQFEVDAYPIISKTFHGYFNYGYSDAVIFPKHRVGAELYAELPKAFEVSLGARHVRFDDGNATIFTGSFGLYRGNYYMSARPYISARDDGQIGMSGSLLARKYGRDGDNYYGLRATYGFDAELNQFIVDGNLLSQTQLFLESQILELEYQFSDKKKQSIYTVNAGVRRQELAFGTGGFFWAVSAGLKYQLRF